MVGGAFRLPTCIVLITAPKGEGRRLSRLIVEEKLGACVNSMPVNSIYWWKEKIEEDEEDLLVIKTACEKLDELVKAVKEAHPYTVPEIIYWRIEGGNPDYIRWVEDTVRR